MFNLPSIARDYFEFFKGRNECQILKLLLKLLLIQLLNNKPLLKSSLILSLNCKNQC